jgi:hypothetical protein
VPGAPGANITAYATENWSGTANGTGFNFSAIKTGTLTSVELIKATATGTVFKADSYTFQDSSSTTLATVTATAATFTQPVGFPVKTAAQWNAITGSVGQQVCVSDSAGGSNPNGMMAFWDTTNNRWSYIHDNGAV